MKARRIPCLLLVASFSAPPALATMAPAEESDSGQTASTRAPDAERAGADIRAVMAGDDFTHRTQSHELRLRPVIRDWLKRLENSKKDEKKDHDDLSGLWSTLARGVSWVVGHILWLLAFAVLLAAFLYRRKWLPWLQQVRPTARVTRVAKLSVEDATDIPAVLPDDIPAAARSHWQNGDARAALSLLYRGASRALSMPDYQTESENLLLVRRSQTPEVIEGYECITRAWRDLAWARRPPADFPALCAIYARLFPGSPT